MAGVIETLIVPRLSGFLTAHVTLVASSPISQLSLRWNFVSESRGKKLNINSFRSSRSVRLKSKFSGCGGRIVYEAQETVVQVLPVIDGNWQPLVLESNLPVLVEFWAPWCGPCRMIHPVIDELGKEYTGKLTCYKVNTDESPSIATKYGIRTIPTASSSKMERRRKQLLVQFQEQLCVPALRSFCRGTY